MSDNSGCLAVVIILVRVFTWIISGVLAWDWVEPESFGGGILFLIAWGIVGAIIDFVGGFVLMALFKN